MASINLTSRWSKTIAAANGVIFDADDKIDITQLHIDKELSDTSKYPIENKVIKKALDLKSDAIHTHTIATVSTNGYMSKDDKTKLNGISNEATKNIASSIIPKDLGTATVGISDKYSREDHIHKMPTAADVSAVAKSGDTMTGRLNMPAGDNLANGNGAIIVGSTNSGQHLNIYNYGLYATNSNKNPARLYLNPFTWLLYNQRNGTNLKYSDLIEVVIGSHLLMNTADTSGVNRTYGVLRLYPPLTAGGDNLQDGTVASVNGDYGGNIVLQAGGETIVGSGESGTAYLFNTYQGAITQLDVEEKWPTTNENLFLTSDDRIFFVCDCQKIVQRKIMVYDNNCLYSLINSTSALGYNAHPWHEAYIETIKSKVQTTNYINGFKGYAAIDIPAIGYVPIFRSKSKNGVFVLATYDTHVCLSYATNSNIDAGKNNINFQMQLMNEAGESRFNKITAGIWNGTAIDVAHGGTGAATAAAALTNLGAAAATHNHAASNITSGTLPVARGGTGVATLTSGAALIGNGANAVTTRNITNNTTTSAAIVANTNLVTGNTLKNALNRNSSVAAADTAYTTYMARGIAAGTSVPSSITNGCMYVVYA